MELCAEVTVLLQVLALRGDHLLTEAERDVPFEQFHPDCCRFSVTVQHWEVKLFGLQGWSVV